MPDYARATQQAKARAEANADTARSNRDWVFRNLDIIEIALAGKDTYQTYLQWLNDEHDFGMSLSVFANYLSDARRYRSEHKPSRRKVNTPATQPGVKSKSDPHPADWNDTEKLIGYRLEDCIRPFVRVEDGKIIRKFKKGTLYSPEMRRALARLDNVVHPD